MPLRALILAFVLGAAWLQTWSVLPALRWFWLLPPVWFLTGLCPDSQWGKLARSMMLLALALSMGVLYAAWRAELRLHDELPAAWAGRDIRLTGRVVGLPETTPRGGRLLIDVVSIQTPAAQAPGRVQVGLYDFTSARTALPRAGDCLHLTVRLSRPHGSVNPGGFDYEGWLLERGIRAQGYVLGRPEPATTCPFSLAGWIDGWRASVRQRLGQALAEAPHAGIVLALAVGDQNAISDSQWTLFRQTGVTHLMSISGLHVTLLASLVYGLVNLLWRRMPALVMRLPAQRAATLAGLITAAAYVALAGFGLPAQRTLYMVATVALGLWLGRMDSPTRVLAAAAGMVVLIDPWAALAPGFWLSFGAVAVLFYAGAGRLGKPPLWLTWARAQWAVTLALSPVLLLLFHELSLVSPIANAFAIPLVSLVAVPLILVSIVLPIDLLLQIAHAVLAWTLLGLEWLAEWPQPVWHGAAPDWLALSLALIGVAVLLLPRGIPARWLGLLLWLPMLFPRLEKPEPGAYWLDLLDVGQGQAVVVRTTGHVMVYDAGPRYASGEDAGRRVVAPYLYAQGIVRLDGMLISHLDSDHFGGAASLVASHRPGWQMTSAELPGWWRCEAGITWQWDGVRFDVLHPPAHYYELDGFTENDLSCVLKITGAGGSTLLTGDIERLGELSLLEKVRPELPAQILIVPHHGSGGSSMEPFVQAVQPAHALLSVGHHNRFGHPAPEVLSRFRQAQTRIHRTDSDGAVQIKVKQMGVDIVHGREKYRRYWHENRA